ncbi:uncharacterized protein LOC127719138 [Mytilus californianus]|uniref:uncharacterized protein LOC127719138 n=1 Tax=Mytilus californianus TaxID=6549 RepID=UPI00224522CA|nr:uncharacterized protein LOC127719138 [Mytilus californianus]
MPTQPTFNRSILTTVNQPVNHRATGQQPPQPTINRSNPITAHRSTPPVRERKPCQQPQPTVNSAHQPPCPRSTRQSTSQQNYTIPSNTAERQNFIRVIDNPQHQPPISQPWFQHSRKAVQAHIAQGKTPEVKQAAAPTPVAQSGLEIAEAHAVAVIESMEDPQEPSVGTCSTSQQDETAPLARKRKQKPRLLKRVATAMMLLFETPEKVSTLEQPAVPVELAVIEDCCHTSSLDSMEPVASQPTPECDLLPFSTGMELIFTPSTARIVMDSHSDCVVAATAPEEGITISGFSEEEIKTGQESDPDLMFILPYLKDGSEPLSNDLFLASPAAKSHWINKQRFFMDDNGVLKSQPKTEGANTRLVVPASLRQTVMELSHELPSAGHQGVSRTMSKIKDKYHWYNMTKDINVFVLSCDTCNKNKKASRHGNKTKPTTPQYCVCRGPDTGETMVQCDNCREWFHLTCIGMSIQEANEIDPYICPNCQLVRTTPPSKDKGGGEIK